LNKNISRLKLKINKKYKEILEAYFPTGTKRRYFLALLKKGFYTIYREGLRGFLRKAKKKIIIKKKVSKEALDTVDLPSSIELFFVPNILPIKVSVIILTKNAGNEFDYILKKITNQKGISKIEIIIVDSTSDDATLEIAKRYTEKWFIIKSEDFHNSRTRNFAADKSSGDYLIFMLQDAIPGSNDLFYNMLFPMVTKDIHALTVKKVPRIDADLFSSWLIWQEYNYLDYSRDYIRNNKLFVDFSSLDLKDKVKYSFLDDVCLAINKEIFERHKFNYTYCEDLELGKRLIINGHNLMFVNSHAVVYSHDNDALYFLKRGCVNSYFIKEIFDCKMGERDFLEISNTIKVLIRYFVFALNTYYDIKSFDNDAIFYHYKYLNNLLNVGVELGNFNSTPFLKEKSQKILGFFSKLEPVQGISSSRYDIGVVNRLLNTYQDILNDFKQYCDILGYKKVDEDFLDSLFKLFCFSIGGYLGEELVNVDYFRGDL